MVEKQAAMQRCHISSTNEEPGGEMRDRDLGQAGYVTINRKSQVGDHWVKRGWNTEMKSQSKNLLDYGCQKL